MSFFSTSHEKLIRKFIKHEVDFVLIGGHAVVSRKIDGLLFRIIDIRDLIKNKQNLNRDTEKSLIDQYDIKALTKILKSK